MYFLELLLISVLLALVIHFFMRLSATYHTSPTAKTDHIAEASNSIVKEQVLTEAHLIELTGMQYPFLLLKERRVPFLSIAVIGGLISGWLFFFNSEKVALVVMTIFVFIEIGLFLWQMIYLADRKNYKALSGLLKEVVNFNQLVNHIYVFEQLQAAGNPIELNEREKIIEALHITRDDLIRALKTERILREHPDFNSQTFEANVTALQALQITEQSSEYNELLNRALNVGLRIQEEMRHISRRE